jgi:hypothetical protein
LATSSIDPAQGEGNARPHDTTLNEREHGFVGAVPVAGMCCKADIYLVAVDDDRASARTEKRTV